MSNVRDQFEAAGQGHVFRFYNELGPAEQKQLLGQAERIDLQELGRLIEMTRHAGAAIPFQDLEPAPYIPLPGQGGDPAGWDRARVCGEEALLAGRVAAFTVAGGQGTRLGYDGPKGTFQVTPVAKKSLFQVFAEKLRAASRRYGKPILWFIMTSDINHEATVEFFEEHGYFGLDRGQVQFFAQGLMPAVDFQGKLLLAGKGELALSPDGHGGSLRALVRNGCVERMRKAGVDLVSYFQVDNPLVRCLDPAFIGFHVLRNSTLSSKTVPKARPDEKVGVFCQVGAKLGVVEYSDLPAALIEARDPDGKLKFRAGSVAVHILSRDLIEELGSGANPAQRLPFHLARKKVPFVNEAGESVEPKDNNGIKFEMFVFDALPFARNPIVVETSREDDFSPVKNAEGVDSPETCRQDQLRMFARWARAAGFDVPADATGLPAFEFEISPLFADSKEEFVARKGEAVIGAGVVLE